MRTCLSEYATGGADEMVTHPRRIIEFDCPNVLGDGPGGDDIVQVDCNVRYTALLTKKGRVIFMYVRTPNFP
jgi:hypothetical protein